jgi:hypothetical protein
MKPFKPGGLRTLLEAASGVPVLPVTSYGGSRMFQKGLTPIQSGVALGLIIHPPVMPPDMRDDGAFLAFVKDLEATIAGALPPEDQRGEAQSPRKKARREPRVMA